MGDNVVIHWEVEHRALLCVHEIKLKRIGIDMLKERLFITKHWVALWKR